MAGVLGDEATARRARNRAESIAAHFDADWWDARGGTYAMSLENPGNILHPVPHWAVIVPLEVGLSTPEHAAQTFATLRAHYLNRWGLKHTVGTDERVWTLPTALLSRAAYRYAEPELGFEMLRHAAETLEAGSIGLFHELIPEGACFIQLWSAATFIRGMIEDLLGITVDAAQHHLSIAPHLPAGWDSATLEKLTFGAHTIRVRIDGSDVTVAYLAGQEPLTVTTGEKVITLLPGETG
jgi:glycogen debranching enzyme